MQVTETISILEIVWTTVAIFGFMFMLLLLQKSKQDLDWLDESQGNGELSLRKNVATTTMLIYVGGVVTQASYLTLGIIAMTQPNSAFNWLRILINSVFIGGSVVSSMIAGAIYTRRSRLVRLVEKRLAEGESKDDNTTTGEPITVT
jgi:hypothetical protein